MPEIKDPLFGDVPESVPLRRAPLVSVLVQVRFSEVLSISRKDFVAPFQERIRKQYPRIQEEAGINIQFGEGNPELQPITSWRFMDETGDWIVVLTTSFVTLQTKVYSSRDEFVARARFILDALTETIRPDIVQRIGVRYVDQIRSPEFERLHELISDQIKGLESPALGDRIVQSMHETICTVREGKLRARWGIMPKNGTHDPVLPRIDSKSWVLDIDTFEEFRPGQQAFDAAAVAGLVGGLAGRCYTVFRWAVTTKFLETYGGND